MNPLFLLVCVFAFYHGVQGQHSNKGAVILVPGAFHQAAVYDDVKNRLENAQYQVDAVDLPSVARIASRDADIQAVRRALLSRLGQNRDVILVGNSYGGTVINEAVRGMKERVSGEPRRGRILGLIFLSGYLPYITEVTQPDSRPDIRQVSPDFFRFAGDKVYWDNDLENYPPEKTFYNLSPPVVTQAAIDQLRFSTFDALNATAQYIAYTGDFRCLYVIGSRDNSVPPAFAQTYIDQPTAQFEMLTINSDHTPMLSLPGKTVEIIREFAGE